MRALPSLERSETRTTRPPILYAESEGPSRAFGGGCSGQSIVGAACGRSVRRRTGARTARRPPRPKLWPASDRNFRPQEYAKPAYKPGSVTARDVARYDRHSSRPAVTDGLEPPTRGLGEQRRRPPIWRCSGWRLPRFTRSQKGSDSSLWPCSSPSRRPRGLGYMRPGVTRHPALWSPDFPLPRNEFRSSDDLAGFAPRL